LPLGRGDGLMPRQALGYGLPLTIEAVAHLKALGPQGFGPQLDPQLVAYHELTGELHRQA